MTEWNWHNRDPRIAMTSLDWDLLHHQQNLQLHGVHVPDMPLLFDRSGRRVYREFRLQVIRQSISLDTVSLKLPVVPLAQTPYSFCEDMLYYQGRPLAFTDILLYRVPLPLEESPWHLKGYTFPFRGSHNPYYELRLNLRISGYCPGRCFFCHRIHSHRIKPDRRVLLTPDVVLGRIAAVEGPEVFARIGRVVLICELFGHENRFLEAVAATAAALERIGYPPQSEFGCCAQDVRSPEGLRKLVQLVRPARYSYTLEFFRDRAQLMGPYKGLPLEQIKRILTYARQAGFQEIQVNYLAGIDSLEACTAGFEQLVSQGLVDSVGLSTFIAFDENQLAGRHPSAREPGYYLRLAEILKQLGLKAHRPESFDMGCPYTALMEKTNL